MAGISFIGSYSGVDQSTIDKLMQVEKLPLNQLTTSKTDIAAKQNAWKDVNTRLNSLFEKLKALQSPSTFNSMTTKSSNDSIINAAASKDAVAGKYDISVERLATNTRIVGANVDLSGGDINKALGIENGKNFTITNKDGDKAVIEITDKDSLKTIVEKINDKTKDTGINATIIDNRIVLSDEKTGVRNITLTGGGNETLTKLGLNGAARTTQAGIDAEFTINGVVINSDSNTVKDVALGLTVNLNKAHAPGEYDSITVATDTENLTKTVKDFVDQYNSTMSFIEEQLAAGTVTDEGTTGRGNLAGDSSLRSLQAALRTIVTDSLSGNDETSIKDISALGVKTTDKSGKLSFDSSKLLEEFSKDPNNVINFFNKVKDVAGEETNVGFAARLKEKIDTYISSKDGLIKSKNESFDRTLKDINKRIDSFNDRMIKKEEYYTKMFAALDVAMMEAESQMSWLSGQISAMNGSSKK